VSPGTFTVPAGTPPLEHRARELSQYGARTYDMLASSWSCPACAAAVAGPPAMILPRVHYRLPGDLQHWVAETGSGALEETELPSCDRCGREAELVALDYFAHHAALAADVVVRWSPSGEARLLRWSAGDGFAPLTELSDDEARLFARDAILRGAAAARDRGALEEADQTLLEAAQVFPGDPAWLTFLPWLDGRAKFSVAGAIAGAHAGARPDDPEGHFWLGQITVSLVAQKVWGSEKLADAEAHFGRALERDPAHAFARLGLANAARIRGDVAAAREHLRTALTLTPDHPESLYTLGLLELATDPDRALALFERGATLRPGDADFPRGMGRALLALGRPLDAQAAAARAKQLAPNDARLDELLLAALAATKT
jgi:tetratricopeptide (TPR) repeat protein